MTTGDILDRGLTPFSPEELEELRARVADGTVRRFGAFANHLALGFASNALAVWQVPEARLDGVGAALAASPSVSHCYARETRTEWPYNLYAMVHARTADELAAGIRTLAEMVRTVVGTPVPCRVLRTVREYKKAPRDYAADAPVPARGMVSHAEDAAPVPRNPSRPEAENRYGQ